VSYANLGGAHVALISRTLKKSSKLFPHYISANTSPLALLDWILNLIPGSVLALASLDLLLNLIPGSVLDLASLDLLLNLIPGSVLALASLDWLLIHIPGSVFLKSKNLLEIIP